MHVVILKVGTYPNGLTIGHDRAGSVFVKHAGAEWRFGQTGDMESYAPDDRDPDLVDTQDVPQQDEEPKAKRSKGSKQKP